MFYLRVTGDQSIISPSTPHNQRVFFSDEKHTITIMSTFQSKNMRFLKFLLSYNLTSLGLGVDFCCEEVDYAHLGSIAFGSPTVQIGPKNDS